MPCCGTPLHITGEWYFSDSGRVPILDAGATSFYRNRGDNGEVNLNRLNSNIMMPTGRFCCKVPDATNALQTVCAKILLSNSYEIEIVINAVMYTSLSLFVPVSVQITDSTTTPTLGRNFSLTYNITGAGNHTTTYDILEKGFSHIGQYTCIVTVNNCSITKYSDKDIIPISKVISLIRLEHTATVDECIELLISNLHFNCNSPTSSVCDHHKYSSESYPASCI